MSKPSLAIAHSMKRKSKYCGGKMASGGTVESGNPTMNMAEGGFIGSHQSPCHEHCNHPGLTHEQAEPMNEEFNKKHPAHSDAAAVAEDDRELGQHGEIEEGPTGTRMSRGGPVQDESHEFDMVGRVMAQRQKMFSKGGRVANSDLPVAGFKPNEFDDLHLRDDLESNYTGENSGDEISNPGEDERRKDIVGMVMASRRKRPARVAR